MCVCVCACVCKYVIKIYLNKLEKTNHRDSLKGHPLQKLRKHVHNGRR